MFCNKCGAALPSKGIVCPSCGTMISKSQADMMKSIEDENRKKSKKPSYATEQLGVSRDFELRDKESNNYKLLFITLFVIIISIVLIILMVI